MSSINQVYMQLFSKAEFFILLAKIQAVMFRKFDGRLGGLGFNEFIILYNLSQAPEEKMRRIDLADSMGLTASGITRLLAPMEKIGMIKREANAQDARVSLVTLAKGGKRLLTESTERAEMLSEDALPGFTAKDLDNLSNYLKRISLAN